MIDELVKAHVTGTHRLVAPQTTLARIHPHLATFGITRCADITGLDRIGIPVYVAVRPQGRILQTSNGKGLTEVDAKVSAMMEAIEHWHAESPNGPSRRCSLAEIAHERVSVLAPRGIDGCPPSASSRRQVLDWVRGRELIADTPAWIPAYAAYYHRDLPYVFSYNGLASGNHPVEASLHALYEIIERHTLAALDGRRRVRFERCQVLDPTRPTDDAVGSLIDRIRSAELELVMMRAPSPTAIHTMLAVILDRAAFGGASMVNLGSGAHLSPAVAAIRAITEAAQSRLTFIHGSREDLNPRAYERGAAHEALFAYFSTRVVDTKWQTLEDHSTRNLQADLSRVLRCLLDAGLRRAYLADLGHGIPGISTVKVLVPKARCPAWV